MYLLLRCVGAFGAILGYLVVREFVSFEGMYRSYDILTAGLAGSLAGAAICALRDPRTPLRRRWALRSPLLAVVAVLLLWADRRWDIGLSVRLVIISLVATYEAGGPGMKLVHRSAFALLSLVGALLHAHLFMEGAFTMATFESIGTGLTGAIFVLSAVYFPGGPTP